MADFISQLPVRIYGSDGVNEVAILTDAAGNLQIDLLTDAQRYTDGTALAAQVGIPAMGTDGANLQFISVDNTGAIQVAGISGTVTVDTELNEFDLDTGSGTDTQPAIGMLYGTDGGAVIVSEDNPLPVAATVVINTEHIDDSAFTVGTDYVGAVGMLADETASDSVDEGDIGIPRMTLDRKQLVVLVDASTDANRLTIDASGFVTTNVNGTVTVTATALDIRALVHTADSIQIGDGTANTWAIDGSGLGQVDIAAHALTNVNALPISKDNSANSETNPIFVQMASGTSGQEAHDYDTAAAVAKDGTDNHDYVVTGTTFLLKRVIATGSGAMKIEVQAGPSASLVTVAVAFNSTATPNMDIVFDPPLEVPVTGTGTVRVIRTNRDNQAQDLYSTIMGSIVA